MIITITIMHNIGKMYYNLLIYESIFLNTQTLYLKGQAVLPKYS